MRRGGRVDTERINLYRRELLLAENYRRQPAALGLALHEVDGTRPIEEMAETTRRQFAGYLTAFSA